LAYSRIIITQSAVSGAAGTARDDIALFTGANEVTFSNDPDGNYGVATYAWTLLEAPVGSVAVLTNPTSAVCTLEPDVYGSYVVALSVNGLGRGTEGYSETIVGCRYDEVIPATTVGKWRVPAWLDKSLANWSGNSRGAQPEIHKFMDEVRNYLMPFASLLNPWYIPFEFPPHMITRHDLPSPAWAGSGIVHRLNMADYPGVGNAFLYGVMMVEGTPGIAHARLYDVTNNVAVVTTGQVDITVTVPTFDAALISGIGANPGDLRDDGYTTYRLDIDITGGTPGVDYAQIFEGGLIFTP